MYMRKYNVSMACGIKNHNICVRFNDGFTNLISVQHPSIYKFINVLRRQLNLTKIEISQTVKVK
jgi:hypothetical protein